MPQSTGKKIAKNTLFLYIRMGAVLLVGLYTTRIVLRVLGVEDFGVYSVIGGVVSMFGVLNTSVSSAINRYFNFYIGRNDSEGITTVYNTALQIQAIVVFVIILFVETVGLWYLNDKIVLPENRIYDAQILFQCSVVSLLFMLLQAPYNAAITAYERMGFYAFISIVDVVLKLLIVFLLQVTSFDKLVFYGILMAVISLVNFILNYSYCKYKFSALKFKRLFNWPCFKSMISFSGWSLLDPLSYMVRGQGCNLVLNYYFGPIINAAYSIANQVAVSLDSFSMNISVAFRPQIIQSYSAGDYIKSTSLVFSMSRIMFMLNLVLFLPIIFETDYMLSLWLGNSVPASASSFILLVLILKLVTVLNPPLTNLMSAIGKIKAIMISSFITICSILPLSIIVFNHGMRPESMYCIMIVSAIINQILASVIVARQFSYFQIYAYIKKVILPCIALSALVVVPMIIVNQIFAQSFLRVVLSCGVSSLFTLLLGFYLVLDSYERMRMKIEIQKLFK